MGHDWVDEGYNGECDEFGADEVPYELDFKDAAWVKPSEKIQLWDSDCYLDYILEKGVGRKRRRTISA